MPKTDLKKILKQGTVIQPRAIDFTSRAMKEEVQVIAKKQEEILNRETVDWKKLSNLIIKV